MKRFTPPINKYLRYNILPLEVSNGCQYDKDTIWGIEWYYTNASTIAIQSCPGTESSGTNYIYIIHTYLFMSSSFFYPSLANF